MFLRNKYVKHIIYKYFHLKVHPQSRRCGLRKQRVHLLRRPVKNGSRFLVLVDWVHHSSVDFSVGSTNQLCGLLKYLLSEK